MSFQQTGNFTQANTTHARVAALQKALELTVNATYETNKISDQETSHVVGELVRHKFMSAEDSYRLKDLLAERSKYVETILDQRIEASLKRKGIFTTRSVGEVQTRLQRVEQVLA